MKPQNHKTKGLASNEEWQAWGKVDPRYGVATKPGRAQDGSNPWTDESFYELGAIDWDLFRRKWEQYGLTAGTCVEIGCGAGRMTVHLAGYFELVHGVDVSAGMLDYARARMPPNVSLHLTGGLEIPLPDNSADAVFSTHVLQHLSSMDAAAHYFRQMHRVLRPGGCLMVHVPVIAWPWGSLRGLHKAVHRAKVNLDAWRARWLRLRFRRGWTAAPPMQITWYEIGWLYRAFEEMTFEDIEIRILFGGSSMAVQHPFVFARKRQA